MRMGEDERIARTEQRQIDKPKTYWQYLRKAGYPESRIRSIRSRFYGSITSGDLRAIRENEKS